MTNTKKTIWKSCAAIVALLLVATSCRQQHTELPSANDPYRVEITLSTNTIHIGDVVTATLDMLHPSDTDAMPPPPVNDKQVVLRNQSHESALLREDDTLTRTTYRYELTSFRPGTHLLWTQQVQFAVSDGSTVTKPIPDTRITVESILTQDDTGLRPNKGNADWVESMPFWFYLLLTGILGAIILMLYLVKRRGGRGEAIPAIPPPPPDVAALTALQELLERRLIEEHRIEEFYVGVSNIVRTYLEDRFRLRAPEQTTEEFIYEAVHSRLLSAEHQQLLRDFLEQCDLVKFARHEPEEQDMHNAHEAAKRFVIDTRPQPDEEVPS